MTFTYPDSLTLGDLPEALAKGLTVVTATRRLARALQLEYARAANRESWPTPRILPWSAWVQEQFRELRDFGLLGDERRCLDESQAGAVWEDLVARDPATAGLLMSGGVADGFRDAWRLVHEWRLSWSELHARAGEDARAFLRLSEAFRRRLSELDAIDPAQIPAMLAVALEGRPGEPVAFCGFDRFNPGQAEVFAALGPRARQIPTPDPSGRPKLFSFPDARQELAAAAWWARAELEANPEIRIGIVVPDLEARAPLLEQLLDDALVPQRLWPGRDQEPRPWNLSLARPLAETPLVATAMQLLSLQQAPPEAAKVGRVLRSPFIAGAATEAAARARADAWLREHGSETVGLGQLLRVLRGDAGVAACPLLADGLLGCLEQLDRGPKRRLPSAWAADFSLALGRLGWPGDAALDSAEWQTVQAWTEALDGLAALDGIGAALSLGEALARLRRITSERRFQPESAEVPIQVLGIPETAGLSFDALWVTGLHDGVLPASLRPCALLPASLQRERGMPRACPDTEQAIARGLVDRLSAAAGTVLFSYPRTEGDEPLRPSPVLEHLGAPVPAHAPGGGVAPLWFAARALVAVSDARAPGVEGSSPGGSALLADQAACPFRAFARHRLRTEPLQTAGAGVDPRTRGSLLHDALRRLWESWGRSAVAAAMEPDARWREVRSAVAWAAAQHLAGQSPALVDIEIEAGAKLIAVLLEQDLARPAFEVLACESSFEVELAPLRIRGRMDRVDRLGEQVVVIDYKTGAAEPGGWDGARPREPQMPLYALALQEPPGGLLYGSLKPGDVGFRGRTRIPGLVPSADRKVKELPAEDWDAMLAEWRESLGGLARDFGAGEAAVDPLWPTRRNGSCSYCGLQVLCRRDELLRAGAIGDE
jgi:probable DNA repair protein